MTNLNYIPTVADFNPDLTYRYDDLALIEQFAPSKFQRKLIPSSVKDYTEYFINGRDFQPIEVNICNLHIIDGNNRVEAYKKACESGAKPIIKVRFIECKTDLDELNRIIEVNSGKAYNNQDVLQASLVAGIPNVSVFNQFAKDNGRLTCKPNGKPKVQNCEVLIFGSILLYQLKRHGDYPKITAPMLKLAKNVVNDVTVMLDVFGSKGTVLKGSRERDLLSAWRTVRVSQGVASRVADSVGIKAFAEVLDVVVKENYGGSTLGTAAWVECMTKTAERLN